MSARERNHHRDIVVFIRIQEALACKYDKLEEVTGGDDLRRERVPKYRCQSCGQTYALPKGPNGMN